MKQLLGNLRGIKVNLTTTLPSEIAGRVVADFTDCSGNVISGRLSGASDSICLRFTTNTPIFTDFENLPVKVDGSTTYSRTKNPNQETTVLLNTTGYSPRTIEEF